MIVPIEEAREILGNEAKKLSDDEVEQLIRDLDVMAVYALHEAQKMREEAALALALLIYDIYKEKTQH